MYTLEKKKVLKKINLSNFRKLGKKEQIKPKVSVRKEIIKIEQKSMTIFFSRRKKSIDETKSWFFEQININKPLDRLNFLKRLYKLLISDIKKETPLQIHGH